MIRAAITPKPRRGRCKVCHEPFEKVRSIQPTCDKFECKVEYAERVAAKAAAKRVREAKKAVAEDRRNTKARKEAMKGINELKAEAQKVFNQFIHARDFDKPCICCGKFATPAALAQPGGAYDACHYRSRGSADHLRFDENNVHRGLKDCNTWGHKDYRGGLIARIGIDAVEALESNQTIVKWTKDGLRTIKAQYKKKLKELQGERK